MVKAANEATPWAAAVSFHFARLRWNASLYGSLLVTGHGTALAGPAMREGLERLASGPRPSQFRDEAAWPWWAQAPLLSVQELHLR